MRATLVMLGLLALAACTGPESLALPEGADAERGLFVFVDSKGEFRAARSLNAPIILGKQSAAKIYWVGLPFVLDAVLPVGVTKVSLEGAQWALPPDATVHQWRDGVFVATELTELNRLLLPFPSEVVCLQLGRCVTEATFGDVDGEFPKQCSPTCDFDALISPLPVALSCGDDWRPEQTPIPFPEFPKACVPPRVSLVGTDCFETDGEGFILTSPFTECREIAAQLPVGQWPTLPGAVDVSFRVRPGPDNPSGCRPEPDECSLRQAIAAAGTANGVAGIAMAPGDYGRPPLAIVARNQTLHLVGSGRATHLKQVRFFVRPGGQLSISDASMTSTQAEPLIEGVAGSSVAFSNVVLACATGPCLTARGYASVQDSLLYGPAESFYGCSDAAGSDEPCSPAITSAGRSVLRIIDSEIQAALGVLAQGEAEIIGSRFFFGARDTPTLAVRSSLARKITLRSTAFVEMRRALVHRSGPDSEGVFGRDLIVTPVSSPAPRVPERERQPEDLWIAFSLRAGPSKAARFEFDRVYVANMNEAFEVWGWANVTLQRLALLDVGAGLTLDPNTNSNEVALSDSYVRSDRGTGLVVLERSRLRIFNLALLGIDTERHLQDYAPLATQEWDETALLLGSSVVGDTTNVPVVDAERIQIYSIDQDVFRGTLNLILSDLKLRFDSGGSLRRWIIDTSNQDYNEADEPATPVTVVRADIDSHTASIRVVAGQSKFSNVKMRLSGQRTAAFCASHRASLVLERFSLSLTPPDGFTGSPTGFIAQATPPVGVMPSPIFLGQGILQSLPVLLEVPFQQPESCGHEVRMDALPSIELKRVRSSTTPPE